MKIESEPSRYLKAAHSSPWNECKGPEVGVCTVCSEYSKEAGWLNQSEPQRKQMEMRPEVQK